MSTAEYQRKLRERNPERRERDRLVNKAHAAAMRAVINRRRWEFEDELAKQKALLGIEDRPRGRPSSTSTHHSPTDTNEEEDTGE